MKIMEKFGVPEPQWILDRVESGPLFWRRDPDGNKARVKFRCDVDVREFSRAAHEMEDYWPEEVEETSHITMVLTAFVCLTVTVFLPWYIIGI